MASVLIIKLGHYTAVDLGGIRQEMEMRNDDISVSTAAAEAKRIEEIGKAQRTFGKAEKINLTNGNPPENGKGRQQKEKKIHYLQKHSESGLLAEAVIVGGVPYFAVSRLNSTKVTITLEESIPITDKSEYKPLEESAYLNKPYKFESAQEFNSYIDKAKSETLSSLYRKVKGIWSKYIDADDFHISICAADTVFTYYQDKIGLTHYLFFVGPPGSGKSNNLSVFSYLAYRNFTSTDLTAANIYQFLGDGEEGQGTLCEDEADRIDEDRMKMAIVKNGYIKGFPVARTDTSFGRKQLKLNTFCYKAFAAESFPDPISAKGFIQRCLEIQCSFGNPRLDITEVTNPAGEEEFQHLLEELNEARNTLLMVRLLHFHSTIPDIKLNIRGREKQLFKPVLRIFQKSEILAELLPVIRNYVIQKRELYRIISDLIADRQTSQLESAFIWDYIKNNLQGGDIPGKPLSYDTSEFGIISQKEISQTLEHVFGAKMKKAHGIKALQFDTSKLKRLGNVYDLPLEVKVVEGEGTGDDRDVGDDLGIARYTKPSTDEREINSTNETSERENPPIQQVTDPPDRPQVFHRPPSPSPEAEAEEDNAAMVREYERLSKLSRKKSKDAAHVQDGAKIDY
jgi:hypothetical protein